MTPPPPKNVPLVELHRHLEGSVRVTTILDLARQHGLALPATDVESLRPHVQVMGQEPDLVSFLSKFHWVQEVLVDRAAIQRVTREALEDAVSEGIDYLELRFSPAYMGERYGLHPQAVGEAVCEAVAAARGQLPLLTNLIVIMSRHMGEESCWGELEVALACQGQGVVALDLAGDEAHFPGSRFRKHFDRAREVGLAVTVHAGEAAGPESVRQAIEELGAQRIGHGVHAMEDEALMELLAEQAIAIESCPTSNVQTNSVPDLRMHPLPLFLRRGLRVTLATDDPAISGIDLPHEYRVAREQLALSPEEVQQVQEHGVRAAFLSEAQRVALAGRAGERTG